MFKVTTYLHANTKSKYQRHISRKAEVFIALVANIGGEAYKQ